MTLTYSKIARLGLLASALLLTACGEKKVAAAAADPLPKTADAAIQTVIRELAQGNGGILWQALPASYQRDVNTLVQLAGSRIDAELYDQGWALIGRLGKVVEKQQGFIFNSILAERSAAEQAQFQQALPAALTLLKTLTGSALGNSAGLRTFNGQQFCESTLSELVPPLNTLSKLSDDGVNLTDYTEISISVVEASAGEATLRIAPPKSPAQEQRFVQVEGRWLPAELAAEWATEIADAKTKLEGITAESIAANKPQAMGVLTMLDGVLTQIEAAGTQAQFDQALQSAMMPLMGLVMMSQGMNGAAQTPAASPTPPPSAAPISK
jgi:hypothetical protein